MEHLQTGIEVLPTYIYALSLVWLCAAVLADLPHARRMCPGCVPPLLLAHSLPAHNTTHLWKSFDITLIVKQN